MHFIANGPVVCRGMGIEIWSGARGLPKSDELTRRGEVCVAGNDLLLEQ